MSKMSEFEDLTTQEIGNKILEYEQLLFRLYNEWAVSKSIEKPHLIRSYRRKKARLMTLLAQKKKSEV